VTTAARNIVEVGRSV